MLYVVRSTRRRLVRRDITERKHPPLVLPLELLNLLHFIDLDGRVLLELEASILEELGGGLDACTENDEVGGDGGTVFEDDGADFGRIGGGGGEVRKLDGELELDALRLVELLGGKW